MALSEKEKYHYRLTVWLAVFLLLYTPMIAVSNMLFPHFGILKDLVCILMLGQSFLSVLYLQKKYYLSIVYCLFVFFSIVLATEHELSVKVDMFRYRCEFLIAFLCLSSSLIQDKYPIEAFCSRAFGAVYITAKLAAVIGVIEYFFPSLAFFIYGERLTVNAWFMLGGRPTHRLLSTLGNPINFGVYMCMGTAAAIYRIAKGRKALSAWRHYVWIGVFLFNVVYSFSRTAYVVFAGIGLAYVVASVFYSRISARRKLVILSGFALLCVAAFFYLRGNSSVISRIFSINTDSFLGDTRMSRAVKAFSKYPNSLFTLLFGHGVGTVLSNTSQYVFEFGYASVLFESGLLGLTVFLYYAVNSIVLGIRVLRTRQKYTAEAIACVSILVGFLAAMLVEDVYAQYPYNLFFWLAVVIMNQLRRSSLSLKNIPIAQQIQGDAAMARKRASRKR